MGSPESGHTLSGFPGQLREILDPRPDIVSRPVEGVLQLRDLQSGMTFNVTGLSDDAIAIRIDAIQHVKALASKDDLRLVCDYLLVDHTPNNNAGLVAVLVELKKTVGYDKRPREQLRRSLPILRYLHSACEVHYERVVRLQERYALVGSALHPGFDKQPVDFAAARHRVEEHCGIRIRIVVGVGGSLRTLVA